MLYVKPGSAAWTNYITKAVSTALLCRCKWDVQGTWGMLTCVVISLDSRSITKRIPSNYLVYFLSGKNKVCSLTAKILFLDAVSLAYNLRSG